MKNLIYSFHSATRKSFQRYRERVYFSQNGVTRTWIIIQIFSTSIKRCMNYLWNCILPKFSSNMECEILWFSLHTQKNSSLFVDSLFPQLSTEFPRGCLYLLKTETCLEYTLLKSKAMIWKILKQITPWFIQTLIYWLRFIFIHMLKK